jgi:hypothetical protein
VTGSIGFDTGEKPADVIPVDAENGLFSVEALIIIESLVLLEWPWPGSAFSDLETSGIGMEVSSRVNGVFSLTTFCFSTVGASSSLS